MSKNLSRVLVWFFPLLFIQIFVLDPYLLGLKYVPFIYILLFVYIPNNYPKWLVLLIGFFTGFLIDFSNYYGGIHAICCLIICFLRPNILKIIFGDVLNTNDIKIEKESFFNKLKYLSLVVLIHHLFIYLFIVFDLKKSMLILESFFINSLISIVVCSFIIILTNKK